MRRRQRAEELVAQLEAIFHSPGDDRGDLLRDAMRLTAIERRSGDDVSQDRAVREEHVLDSERRLSPREVIEELADLPHLLVAEVERPAQRVEGVALLGRRGGRRNQQRHPGHEPDHSGSPLIKYIAAMIGPAVDMSPNHFSKIGTISRER